MVLVIDPQVAGIAGDMMLCSLADMGADESRIIEGITAAQGFLKGASVRKIGFEQIQKRNVKATRLLLDVADEPAGRSAAAIEACIKSTCADIRLSDGAADFASSCIQTLIAAESRIHGVPADSVHLHEAAGFDTAADIIGTAIALDDLSLLDEEIVTTPVAVGGGSVEFSHGKTSNPAWAVLEIFRGSGILIAGSQAGAELTTPTGACMLACLSDRCDAFYPVMSVDSLGYGAGSQDFEGFANVLKMVRGRSVNRYLRDTVAVLETNVDDVSGEVIGHVIERMMGDGAKDVAVSAALTKKGRPTHLVTVICEPASAQHLAETLISETGTLGVRMRTSERIKAARLTQGMTVRIGGADFEISYKTNSGTNRFKVEYDDIRRVSESIGKSFRETEALIRSEIGKGTGAT